MCGILFSAVKHGTGKSVSEALILESVNPQLFIEFQEKKVHNMLCTKIVLFFCFDIQHVLSLKFSFTELVIQ